MTTTKNKKLQILQFFLQILPQTNISAGFLCNIKRKRNKSRTNEYKWIATAMERFGNETHRQSNALAMELKRAGSAGKKTNGG
ncbi:MAG: hypothetical protein LBL83_08830 [Clostridiales bacterium]|jgi:hypothetical protein|nr:hypothetical protein [Clostridiales bacterium]